MSQTPQRPQSAHDAGDTPPKLPKTPPRRLQTPQERFGIPPETPSGLSFEDETPSASPVEAAETDADDPFAPYMRPKVQGHQHAPRRHELRHHETRRHEPRRHEVRHLERESPQSDKVQTGQRGPRGIVMPAASSAKRAKPKRFSKGWKRFFGTALVLFVGYCGFAALTFPQFNVKEVRLEGAVETPKSQIEPLVKPLVGQNFFRAKRAKVERAVAELPGVASARVVREVGWPPRFRLVVGERHPMLRVGAGKTWWVVDQNGVPYRLAGDADSNLYALTAPQFAPVIGKALPSKAWKWAVELQDALAHDNALAHKRDDEAAPQTIATEGVAQGATPLPEAPFWQLRRLYLDRDGMAAVRVVGRGELRAHNELLIRLGESDWEAKLARARVALSYFEHTGRDASELNLVSYTYPTWRGRGTESGN